MYLKRTCIGMFLALPFGLCVGTASAALIGDTVECAVTGQFQPTCGLSNTAVVGPGPEFVFAEPDFAGDLLTIDIGASSITIQTLDFFLGFDPGSSIILSDLDWVGMTGAIVGIENFSTSGTNGIEASDVSFTANSITFDMSQSDWEGNGVGIAEWDLVTTLVPVPPALWLFGSGLLGLVGIARRKKRMA